MFQSGRILASALHTIIFKLDILFIYISLYTFLGIFWQKKKWLLSVLVQKLYLSLNWRIWTNVFSRIELMPLAELISRQSSTDYVMWLLVITNNEIKGSVRSHSTNPANYKRNKVWDLLCLKTFKKSNLHKYKSLRGPGFRPTKQQKVSASAMWLCL